MQVTTVGVDLAKSVVQVHGVDAAGETVVVKTLRRGQLLTFFSRLEPCLVGMEACGSAHDWALLNSKQAKTDPWLARLLAEKSRKLAAVAVANKLARIAFAMLLSGRPYRPSQGAAA